MGQYCWRAESSSYSWKIVVNVANDGSSSKKGWDWEHRFQGSRLQGKEFAFGIPLYFCFLDSEWGGGEMSVQFLLHLTS